MGQQIIDWSVLDDETVKRNCSLGARAVSRECNGAMEYDDLLQEAYILCATNPAQVKTYLADGNGGYLNRWVWLRLTSIAKRESKFHSKTVPSDEIDWTDL